MPHAAKSSSTPGKKTIGHPVAAASLIGAMSFALAACFDRFGLLRGCDSLLKQAFVKNADGFPNSLPPVGLWAGIAALSFLLPLAMLATRTQWRRTLLWLLALFVIASWAPVLALAAYAPKISAAWIATFWSGFCALYYTVHHLMPADVKPGGRR